MPFIESPRFPDELSAWASGGPSFNTGIVQTFAGVEYRNQNWQVGIAQYEIPEADRLTNAALTNYTFVGLRDLFNAGAGAFNGFRMKDWKDFMDEGHGTVAVIDATHWQLYKTYTVGAIIYQRPIFKPVSPIAVAGGGGYTIDYTTGIITKTGGANPTGWTGTFDTPVRFGQDSSQMGLDSSGAVYSWPSLKLVELRVP